MIIYFPDEQIFYAADNIPDWEWSSLRQASGIPITRPYIQDAVSSVEGNWLTTPADVAQYLLRVWGAIKPEPKMWWATRARSADFGVSKDWLSDIRQYFHSPARQFSFLHCAGNRVATVGSRTWLQRNAWTFFLILSSAMFMPKMFKHYLFNLFNQISIDTIENGYFIGFNTQL